MHPIANSKPPPKGVPCKAATIGLLEFSNSKITSFKFGDCIGFPNSLISAPAKNVLPSPHNNIPLILSALEKISVKSLSVPGFEADDVIATIVKHAAHKKLEAIIISSDTSFCQLVRPGVYSVDAFKKLNRDEKWIEKKFGVKPNKLIDLLSLSGIPALGIKGIPSIGLHTAASLINKYGNLDKVIENSDSISGKVGENIRSNISSLASTKKMVALYQNVEMDSNLNKFRCDRKWIDL